MLGLCVEQDDATPDSFWSALNVLDHVAQDDLANTLRSSGLSDIEDTAVPSAEEHLHDSSNGSDLSDRGSVNSIPTVTSALDPVVPTKVPSSQLYEGTRQPGKFHKAPFARSRTMHFADREKPLPPAPLRLQYRNSVSGYTEASSMSSLISNRRSFSSPDVSFGTEQPERQGPNHTAEEHAADLAAASVAVTPVLIERGKVLEEIVSSEHVHTQELRSLLSDIVVPHNVTETERGVMQILLESIEELLQQHLHLLDTMRTRRKPVAAIARHFEFFIEPYLKYLICVSGLDYLPLQVSEQCESKLTINMRMSTPFQRLLRYPLLVDRVLKLTEKVPSRLQRSHDPEGLKCGSALSTRRHLERIVSYVRLIEHSKEARMHLMRFRDLMLTKRGICSFDLVSDLATMTSCPTGGRVLDTEDLKTPADRCLSSLSRVSVTGHADLDFRDTKGPVRRIVYDGWTNMIRIPSSGPPPKKPKHRKGSDVDCCVLCSDGVVVWGRNTPAPKCHRDPSLAAPARSRSIFVRLGSTNSSSSSNSSSNNLSNSEQHNLRRPSYAMGDPGNRIMDIMVSMPAEVVLRVEPLDAWTVDASSSAQARDKGGAKAARRLVIWCRKADDAMSPPIRRLVWLTSDADTTLKNWLQLWETVSIQRRQTC